MQNVMEIKKDKLTTLGLTYENQYDQKASTKPIPEKAFCLFVNTKALELSAPIANQGQKRLPSKTLETIVTDFN